MNIFASSVWLCESVSRIQSGTFAENVCVWAEYSLEHLQKTASTSMIWQPGKRETKETENGILVGNTLLSHTTFEKTPVYI